MAMAISLRRDLQPCIMTCRNDVTIFVNETDVNGWQVLVWHSFPLLHGSVNVNRLFRNSS